MVWCLFLVIKKKIKRKNEGYVLVEMMIVLLVITTLITISTVNLLPAYNQKKIDFFFEQFQRDILYAQTYAIAHHRSVIIVNNDKKSKYIIQESGLGNILLTRHYSHDIHFEYITLSPRITYHANGNIRAPGKMYIYYQNKKFSVVFLLGKGRVYVKEL